MKILVLSEGRTGSHSLCEWLSEELEIPFIDETHEIIPSTLDGFVKKIYYFQNMTLPNEDLFDKKIVLYRENTFEQAISSIWSYVTGKYHHSFGNFDGYYEISKDFCDKNYKSISKLKDKLDINNNLIRNLENCLIITYEQIFLDGIGQKMLEDYIGFKSKKPLDIPELKLRKPTEEVDEYLRKIILGDKKRLI